MVNALLTQPTFVSWETVTPKGAVDTLDEAVSQWLNEHEKKDLTQLSLADLQSLIKHLESLPGKKIPGLSNLINQLKSIRAEWQQDSGTALDNLQRDLSCRSDMLTALAGATKNDQGNDALDVALKNLKSVLENVNDAVAKVNKSTRLWSANDTFSIVDARQLLLDLDSLRGLGLDISALGLDKLFAAVKAAVDAYDAAPKGSGDNTQEAQLALSKLRQAIAEAKIAYLEKNGATASDPRLKAEQSIVRVEKMWQMNLTIPWLEATEFDGAASSEESITEEIARLQDQYQMLAKMGNRDGMNYVNSRIQILQRALDRLRSGEDAMTVSLIVFTEIKMLEITTKTILKGRALEEAKNDPAKKDLAEKYQAEIDVLQNTVQTVMDEYQSALQRWIDTNAQAISNALRG